MEMHDIVIGLFVNRFEVGMESYHGKDYMETLPRDLSSIASRFRAAAGCVRIPIRTPRWIRCSKERGTWAWATSSTPPS
jgi:hypothetical protein